MNDTTPKKECFSTGSVRDTRIGKGRFDLLPARALARLARHFETGAKKYGDANWEKGQPLSRFLDSALRHAFALKEGKTDEDHLIAAAWNLLCLADTQERVKEGLLPAELDDLPAANHEFASGLPDEQDAGQYRYLPSDFLAWLAGFPGNANGMAWMGRIFMRMGAFGFAQDWTKAAELFTRLMAGGHIVSHDGGDA